VPAGLVLPKYAQSKAEMVAAGVIPIDRLTDVRAPVQVVADRCGPSQIADVYGIRLPGAVPPPPSQQQQQRRQQQGQAEEAAAAAPAAPEASSSGQQGPAAAAGKLLAQVVLGTLAAARGWTAGGGLPDEVGCRAGGQGAWG
jgi:large subunit GTPase 1